MPDPDKTEPDCDECLVHGESETEEDRRRVAARIREIGLWAYIREIRARLRTNYPFRKCWRCWLKEMGYNVIETWRSPRRLAFHVVTEIGTRASHPQDHSTWFGTCLDAGITDFAEWVDREVAHTEMSCQGTEGDPKHPPYLMVTGRSWPALRAWFAEQHLAVSEVPLDVAYAGDSILAGSDVVAATSGHDHDLVTVWLGVPMPELMVRTYRPCTARTE